MSYFEEKNGEVIIIGDNFDLKINVLKEVLYRRKDWDKFKAFKPPKKIYCDNMQDKKKNLVQLYRVLEQKLQASLLNIEEEKEDKVDEKGSQERE